MSSESTSRFDALLSVLTGFLLLVCMAGLLTLSRRFEYGVALSAYPIRLMVALLLLAGGVYFVQAWHVARGGRIPFHWLVAVGLLMRIGMIPSAPILEDDVYRYLWDGAVAAHGISPYRYAPADALDGAGPPNAEFRHVREVALASGPVIERVNHPELRTIYPPVAQGFFALSHLAAPWSPSGWRLLLLLTDLITAWLLVALLQETGLPRDGLVVYWWCPLLLKEIYNSAHLDLLALPFVLGAVLATVRRRHLSAMVLLALGMGIKLWPLVLAPLILRPLLDRPRRLAAAVGLLAATSLFVLGPMVEAVRGPHSGFLAYAGRWEMNDTVFMILVWAARALRGALSFDALSAQQLARIAATALLGVGVLALCRRPLAGPIDLYRRALWTLFMMLTLSPTQFPWYFTWLLPFLALQPRASLLLLMALLPIYYLRFYLEGLGNVQLFDFGFVWLQVVPVWILLLAEWRAAGNLTGDGVRSRRE